MPLDGLTHIIPEKAPDSGLIAVDTSDLMGALLGEDSGNRTGLEKMCRLLGISTPYHHNGGNDAHVSSLSKTLSLSPLTCFAPISSRCKL